MVTSARINKWNKSLLALGWLIGPLGIPFFGVSQILTDWDSDSVLVINHFQGFVGHGVSFCDFNGDGYDDLTFGQFNGNLFTYQSQGDGTFQPIDLGIGNTDGEIKAVLWVDIDGDFDLDLLITQRLAPNKMWVRMPNGVLQEVPEAGGLAGLATERTFGASVGDYDNDGDLDVYFCQMHNSPANTEPNRLFKNLGGMDLDVAFADVTVEAGVGNGVKPSFQSSWIDLNKDGWLDLHVINDRSIFPDAFYLNMQDGTFIDVSGDWGLDLAIFSMSSSFADFDKDLDWDVFVADGPVLDNRLMRCVGAPSTPEEVLDPTFENVAAQAGVELEDLAWAGVWFDADNNGSLDLLIATGTSFATNYPALLNLYPDPRTRLFLNTPGVFPFDDVSEDLDAGVELSFAAVYGDADRDGALEVAVHRVGPTARLLHGQPGQGEWLQVLLDGDAPNTNGIGSIVTAWTDGVPDMRHVHCGTQYLSQNSLVIHFGLGTESQCDSVVVRWPNGEHYVFPELPSGTRAILSQSGTTILQGCTYEGACNYTPQADQEVGTCDFACLCGLGAVWDPEQEQCVQGCVWDLNGDDQIDISDLMEFLTLFGQSCPE